MKCDNRPQAVLMNRCRVITHLNGENNNDKMTADSGQRSSQTGQMLIGRITPKWPLKNNVGYILNS